MGGASPSPAPSGARSGSKQRRERRSCGPRTQTFQKAPRAPASARGAALGLLPSLAAVRRDEGERKGRRSCASHSGRAGLAPASPSRTEDPPLECTRRKKHIQLRSKSDVEPLLLSTGIVHVIPDPPHTAWPLLMGWKHSAKLVICTCRSGGPSGPKNKTKKAAEEQPARHTRPRTHEFPFAQTQRFASCAPSTNPTLGFKINLTKEAFA